MATVYFSPVGNGQTFFNSQGQILAGGKILTYAAGTTTPLATYTDNTGSVQNANPIILNSGGQSANEIWLTANTKFVIEDSSNNIIMTLDNIVAINNPSSVMSEWMPSNVVPTFLSTTQFSATGDQTLLFTVNRRVKITETAGTVYGYVSASSFSTGVTTVTVVLDSGTLDSGISVVSVGLLNGSNQSVPNGLSIPTATITNLTTTTKAVGTNTTDAATCAFVQSNVALKLPTIGCTQTGGALTFTASTSTLDFRSTTLTSGAISTVIASPANLVLPSGGTLGAVSTVSARIIVVELNNAGAAELAIVNISGGNDLSETGVISTTAISAASTANNVFYSTTARTNVAYRVVGAVDVVNTAGAWGTPTLVQGAGGQALTAMSSLGYGQTWQNVTGSRLVGTTYYNTTGKPITVAGVFTNSSANTTLGLTINGVIVDAAANGGAGSGSGLSLVVPPGASYVTHTNGGALTMVLWEELR